MNWVDVAGPPGSGKSTLCDPLWGPHIIPLTDALPPIAWHDFLNEMTRLFDVIQGHKSFISAVRMNRRTLRKMTAVHNTTHVETKRYNPYIQAGFVQRGLGFGWRMTEMGIDIAELAHFFRLMPVSIGVVMLDVGDEENKRRNEARKLVPSTAHEDRSFMIPLMKPAIDLAEQLLKNERNVPFQRIETSAPIEECRNKLLAFADKRCCHPKTIRLSSESSTLSPPVFW
jgi:hypothetical protein